MLDRRALLGSVLAAAALGGCQTATPLASGTPIGAIRVDVSRLVQLGVGPRTATIKAGLEQNLARLLAPTGRRGDATLSVAVRSLTTPTYVGSDADDAPGLDNLESIVTITSAGGQVLATYPLLSSNGSGDAGPWYTPDLIDKRINLLVANHALWIRRYVAG